jgi:hypothetical protein
MTIRGCLRVKTRAHCKARPRALLRIKSFGNKSDKAASSSDKTEVSGELQTALDRLAQERALLAQLLRPLTRPATGEDEQRAEPERR